jgi:peptidoglycan/xylan/chitin deacetylase (PgdA/CDA1 family)
MIRGIIKHRNLRLKHTMRVSIALFIAIVACVGCYVAVHRSATPPISPNAHIYEVPGSLGSVELLPGLSELSPPAAFSDKTDNATNLEVRPPAMVPVPHDYVIPPITDGLAPVLINIPTKRNVVFLGIDDGQNKQSSELQLMRAKGVKASLFLADLFIKDNPGFFKDFLATGSLVEDHTVNHRLLSKLSYEEQKREICAEADLQLEQFGRRPVLFRPPGGDYNRDTRRAAADCGMKAVVNWIAKANGGSMQYQIGDKLRPGDIVLMHFRPEFASDMQAFLKAQDAAGLHTELLEDWLQ